MSLINSMLRDLDARKSDGPGGQFEGQVRAVPRPDQVSPQRWGAVAGAVLVLGAAGAAGAMWLRSSARPAPPAVVMVAPPPAPAPAPMPEAAPVLAAAAPPERVVEPAPARAARAVEAQPPAPVQQRTVEADARPAPSPPVKLAQAVERPPASRVTEPTAQERADTAYAQALDLLRQGKGDAANTALEQALRLNSRHGAARQTLISNLIDQGRKDEAMRVAQDGLAGQPAQPAMAMTLARLQVEKGELRPAIATLERSLPYTGGMADYPAFLAALLQRDEQHRQAVEQYLIALKKAPDAGVWWMGLGISYQALQRPADAIDAFRHARASGALSAELVAFVDGRLGQLQR